MSEQPFITLENDSALELEVQKIRIRVRVRVGGVSTRTLERQRSAAGRC